MRGVDATVRATDGTPTSASTTRVHRSAIRRALRSLGVGGPRSELERNAKIAYQEGRLHAVDRVRLIPRSQNGGLTDFVLAAEGFKASAAGFRQQGDLARAALVSQRSAFHFERAADEIEVRMPPGVGALDEEQLRERAELAAEARMSGAMQHLEAAADSVAAHATPTRVLQSLRDAYDAFAASTRIAHLGDGPRAEAHERAGLSLVAIAMRTELGDEARDASFEQALAHFDHAVRFGSATAEARRAHAGELRLRRVPDADARPLDAQLTLASELLQLGPTESAFRAFRDIADEARRSGDLRGAVVAMEHANRVAMDRASSFAQRALTRPEQASAASEAYAEVAQTHLRIAADLNEIGTPEARVAAESHLRIAANRYSAAGTVVGGASHELTPREREMTEKEAEIHVALGSRSDADPLVRQRDMARAAYLYRLAFGRNDARFWRADREAQRLAAALRD